jgi:hypothetical protein
MSGLRHRSERAGHMGPKHGYGDILGEPRNHPIGFRERGTAFEQEARPARLQSLNRASRVQQTQKSFSTFCTVVPMRLAAARSVGVQERRF